MARTDDLPSRQSVTEKRGRGRPRKPDALTNAQRQAAYRTRHKAIDKSVTVTEKEYDVLRRECEQLREALALAQRSRPEPARQRPDGAGRGDSGGNAGAPVAVAVLTRPVPVDEAQSDDRRVVVTINGREVYSLERLEAHFGLPRRVVLERLIWWADRSVEQSLGDDDAAFNRYLHRVTKNP
ncbi:MAG: hypothetical protein EPN70_22560 [Paraburkholderia sp.]|uniref:hypothetical protein n=1 Tax=Paraburkholderia sp. TaxID=1926495 RepID=UPI00121B4D7A|nr:hypothetical protein [Paraburkholderia sp.]TAM00347.1 MAG: hypothetical protein EPN70_22560 [Paraburkholderia sp.]